ncbi:hypothetical protein IH992_14990 [Candidatus Poribacteria bacterium]|nr:hypothetical protein [Candidatus Poribacteria bacterium]
MSKIHILASDEKKQYRVIIHTSVPAGNNSAGKSWKDVLIGAEQNTSELIIGTKNGGNCS